MRARASLHDVNGLFIGLESFNSVEEAEHFAKNYGRLHSGFAIVEALGEKLDEIYPPGPLYCEYCGKETDERVGGLCPECNASGIPAPQTEEEADEAHLEEIVNGPDRRKLKEIQEAQATDPMIAKPEVTPQDLGEPSPVPYSVFIQRPSPDIDPKGESVIRINLALKGLSDCHIRGVVPMDCLPFVQMAYRCFRQGYYRFELVVGDWSIRCYKHPNNP